jgi:hypothetical protein
VAPERVYVGQQASYRLRLFRRVQWDNPRLDDVKFEGFWVEELGGAGAEKRTTRGGQTYLYQDLLYALFPSAPGAFELQPRVLRYSRLTGNDFFFAIPQPAPPVVSNAVQVEVVPVPEEGRPPDYAGLVGTLEIAASLDRDQTRQDQAVTLTIVVSGIGNPNTFPQPALELPAEVEAFDTKSDVYVNKKRELVSGSRTFKTVLVPRAGGQFQLGPFALWSFDPYKKSYVRVESRPLSLAVEPGKTKAGPGSAPETTRREELRLLGQDIRYLKPIGARLDGYPGPLYRRPIGFVALALPLLGLAALLGWRRHRKRLATDVGFRRRRHALQAAQQRQRAAESAGATAELYRLLELSVVGYVADWFNLTPSSATREQLREHLRRAGAPESVTERLGQFLDECGYYRFASAGQSEESRQRMLQQGRSLLDELQREVQGR